MRVILALAVLLLLGSPLRAAQAPLPANWPTVFQFGMSDAPNGAAALSQSIPGGFRYVYFSGGANTGHSWSTYNSPSGAYASMYFSDAIANGMIPAGVYYMMLQSNPQSGGSESVQDLGNFNNLSTMQAWFTDFTLLLTQAGAFTGKLIVLNVEPDFWGYIEQAATANGGITNVPGQVGNCGGEVNGYANNPIGFAQAILHLRDLHAPNVAIGINASIWGTNFDLLTSVPKPDDAQAMAMGVQSGQFINSLNANFDLLFGEFLDADSAYDQIIRGNSNEWFESVDYRHLREFFANLSVTANKRIVIWQSPIGNTLMRSCNNAWQHYQSNQVEWLLDDLTTTNIADFENSGVIAVLFGGGQGGDTAAVDAAGDGVTNPAPIAVNPSSSNQSPNAIQSILGTAGSPPIYNAAAETLTTPYAQDDDGGYLRWKLYGYFHASPLPLSSGASSASKLAITVQPSTTVAGLTIAPSVQVAIEDAAGATVTSALGSITLVTSSGTGALDGTTSVAVVNGVATFNDLHINVTGANYQLTASAGVFTSTTSSTFSITAPPPPSITSFTPSAAGIGATVTINGANLVGVTTVLFNGTPAPFTVTGSSTQITATVPALATSGVISVTGTGGTGISSTSFTLIPPPIIVSFTPTSGGAGTQVVITGSNFSGATVVSFNGTTSVFSVDSATQITATVPALATNGPITVTTLGGSASSASYTTGISANPSSSSKKCGGGIFGSIGLLLLCVAARRRFR